MSPMPATTGSALYCGRVVHKRLLPFAHAFRYRTFQLFLELDELPDLDRRLRLFSHNRWNLFGFSDRDHGPRDGRPLRPWIDAHLADAGIDLEGGPVRLLCFPRVLGYVFNPLSIWFCHHRDGSLRALLYEVSNTFGERHSYLVPVSLGADGAPTPHSVAKRFYVSPFIGMAGRYDFRLTPPGERMVVSIRHTTAEGLLLVASQSGRRRPLDDRSLLGVLLGYPLLTLKVIAAIHWQALRLWAKGARPLRRPPPPAPEVTLIASPAVAAE